MKPLLLLVVYSVLTASGIALAESNEQAARQIKFHAITQELKTKRTISPTNYAFLLNNYTNNQDNRHLRELVIAATVIREDWPVIIDILENLPDSERRSEDDLRLASAYLKLGNYQKCLEIAENYVHSDPQAVSLAAQAALKLGRVKQVVSMLLGLNKNLSEQGSILSISDSTILMLAYYELGASDEAIKVALKIQDREPGNISSAQLLGRIYADKNDNASASKYFTLARESYARITANEEYKARLSNLSRQLDLAVKNQDFQKVLLLVDKADKWIRPESEKTLKQYATLAQRKLGINPDSKKND